MFFWGKGSSDLTLFVSLADCTLPDSMKKLKGCVATWPRISPCHYQCKMSQNTPLPNGFQWTKISSFATSKINKYTWMVFTFNFPPRFYKILVSMICHLSIPSTEGISSKPQGGMAVAPPSLEEAIRDFHHRLASDKPMSISPWNGQNFPKNLWIWIDAWTTFWSKKTITWRFDPVCLVLWEAP